MTGAIPCASESKFQSFNGGDGSWNSKIFKSIYESHPGALKSHHCCRTQRETLFMQVHSVLDRINQLINELISLIFIDPLLYAGFFFRHWG